MAWPVFQSVARFLLRDSMFYRGEFTGAVGSISLVKFKGAVTATWNSTGLITFNVGVKNLHLKNLQLVFITPTGATVGGWSWSLAANAINSAGTFQVQIQQQSWAVADPVGVVKVAFELSPEAPS